MPTSSREALLAMLGSARAQGYAIIRHEITQGDNGVIAGVLDLVSDSAERTKRLGEHLGRLLRCGDVVCLEGSLGTGKTCLTQGVARGLGVTGPITSPTFIIANEYVLPHRTEKLHHIDLYRVETSAEACATGLEELFYRDGICVIEWAERVLDILPAHKLWIKLFYVDCTTRQFSFEPHGRRYKRLLQRFGEDIARC